MELNTQIEKIWNEFGDKLQRFIASRVNDTAADDILQDIFLKIHANVTKLKNTDKLESWVFQITRNAIIDHYRKKNRYHAALPENLGETEEPATETAEQRVARSLKQMVHLLPEKYSEALLLTDYKGLSQVALAKHLNISVSGAKSRVQRARKLLKEMLLKCCHFEFDRRGTIIDYHPIVQCQCCEDKNKQC